MPQTKQTNTKQFAVIDRAGFFADTTKVYSAHVTEANAVKAARQHRVSACRGCSQSSATVIRSEGGFSKGQTIYRDTIGRQYPVVW